MKIDRFSCCVSPYRNVGAMYLSTYSDVAWPFSQPLVSSSPIHILTCVERNFISLPSLASVCVRTHAHTSSLTSDSLPSGIMCDGHHFLFCFLLNRNVDYFSLLPVTSNDLANDIVHCSVQKILLRI